MRWFIGFFFHEMAFGLLSVFLPLYVVTNLHGSLIDVGLMIGLSSFVAIPFSYLWGYLCDKTEKYRLIILVSFSGLAALLYFFTLTTSIPVLILLYVLIGVFHVGNESPKNVLIAESRPRDEWTWGFALYEALTEAGWALGLLSGFFLFTYSYSPINIILFTCFLSLFALMSSVALVRDPALAIERRLVNVERSVGLVCRGCFLLSRSDMGDIDLRELTVESLPVFLAGFLFFTLATTMLFTPLPIFFSQTFTAGIVFILFFFNSLANLFGYLYAARLSKQIGDKTLVKRATALRTLLCLFFAVVVFLPLTLEPLLSTASLVALGLSYGLFLISATSLSMELIPRGKTGIFNSLAGLGGALGCFAGSFIADGPGFFWLFIVCGSIFGLAYLALKLGLREDTLAGMA